MANKKKVENKAVNNNEFEIQGIKLTMKKPSFKLEQDTEILRNKIRKHLKDYTKDTEEAIFNYDKEIDEMISDVAIKKGVDLENPDKRSEIELELKTQYAKENFNYFRLLKELQQDNLSGLYTFMADKQNIKEILEKLTEGEISKINFELTTNEDIKELIRIAGKVYSNFFLSDKEF